MMTGGWGGKKESYEKLVSRAKFFQHFWADFNPENPEIMPEVKSLFEREDYLEEAKKICQGQQYLDPMQASILVGIPGQEVGLHYDTPWFYGADRNEFPLWLLVAMRTSGLYDDIAINQVQGVAYLHDWTDTEKMGGAFYFFEKGPIGEMSKVDAKPNRGLIVDGTVMSHGL
ncbi:hypothetical protein PPERSA_04173 [Pseudocohnilembus persalinus]|uniref:Prolyl 4-hydroxylase alpha subunit Fe(2+) 2OG dioxygenase domain-containing protein n=1 Tax=Pseudocohnilembus persalinus TaxID=266149 RepID=A0A0V0QNT2_PSEPJ|nr:hypothetical protein PPERSA_04173 [Pseudocohnilembus persalinus]|eukprot:KRX03621.1 hypothetical protein PPERSA_04173 [Pseudocohnilembus persalinus]